MQYLKFTYVDAATGISVAKQPAANGPVFPPVAGLEFSWARESRYPTDVPEFFGTCPDGANTQVDGVLGVYVQAEWETMRDDEMRARNPVPQQITRAQGKAALIMQGLWGAVLDYVAAIQDPLQRALAEVALNDTLTWERSSPFLNAAAAGLGMTDEQLDALFIQAAGIALSTTRST